MATSIFLAKTTTTFMMITIPMTTAMNMIQYMTIMITTTTMTMVTPIVIMTTNMIIMWQPMNMHILTRRT